MLEISSGLDQFSLAGQRVAEGSPHSFSEIQEHLTAALAFELLS